MQRIIYIFIALLIPGASAWADYKADIGYYDLQARLGASTPSGAGITATQVEAKDSGNNYMPDTSYYQFSGKTITAKSGSSGISSHSNTVATNNYGSVTSVAVDIATIDVYEANSWLQSGFLKVYTNQNPLTEIRRVQNHSYIGTTGNTTVDTDALRRADYVIVRDGVLIATGVNNGAGSAVPNLMCSGYNNIAVGVSSGGTSWGPTLIDDPGRVKPDIVSPASLSSWATPLVAASGALLLETMDSNYGYLDDTEKVLLAKCLLLGGATKDEFADWRKGFASPTTDGSVPLDYRYGAGELNIDNSHRILEAGEQDYNSSSDVSAVGWDIDSASSSTACPYFFEIPAGQVIRRLTVNATWFREITSQNGSPRYFTPSLANIDLHLHEATGYAKGPQIDLSVSAIDNVEHIFVKDLPPGRYLIELTSDDNWDYALSWDARTEATVPPDFDQDGYVDGDDVGYFGTCQTAPGIDVSPSCDDADLDNDGDADLDDYAILQRCYAGQDKLAVTGCDQ